MYECHHGNVTLYARKLWAWDDGDSIPENPEISWPTSLYYTDVYQLDNNHPATCFLRSCLCGKPEETGLGAMLLYRGGSDVISSSRVSWVSSADRDGIPYHFYSRLLQDTTTSNGIIGTAYDIARTDFMDNTGFWLPAYHYNLFGDPALRQLGQLVGIEENISQTVSSVLTVFPNPSHGAVTLSMQSPRINTLEFKIYDVSGRLIDNLRIAEPGVRNTALNIHLPAGIYFLKCTDGDNGCQSKIVVLP
jgi:hypothetical protein